MRLEVPHRRLNGAFYARLRDDSGLLMVSGVTTIEGLIALIGIMLRLSSDISSEGK